MGTSAQKHLQNIQNSFVLASGKCVSHRIQLSNARHYGDVRSRRGMSTQRWLWDSREHADSASTSRFALHWGMAVLKWQSWWWANLPKVGFIAQAEVLVASGGGYHTWNSHFRASSSVSTLYSSHFCDCSAEVLLFLSIAPSFYASLINGREKKKITSPIVVRCSNYLLQMTWFFQKTFRIALKALNNLQLKAKCRGYNSFTLCKTM